MVWGFESVGLDRGRRLGGGCSVCIGQEELGGINSEAWSRVWVTMGGNDG